MEMSISKLNLGTFDASLAGQPHHRDYAYIVACYSALCNIDEDLALIGHHACWGQPPKGDWAAL